MWDVTAGTRTPLAVRTYLVPTPDTRYVSLTLFLSRWCPLGGIISVCETPEQLGGLPYIMRASIDKALTSKWVEFKIYPFKEALPRTLYFFFQKWMQTGEPVLNML